MEKEDYSKIKIVLAVSFALVSLIVMFSLISGVFPVSLTGNVVTTLSGTNCQEVPMPPYYETVIYYTRDYYYYFPGIGYQKYSFPTMNTDTCNQGKFYDYSCNGFKPVLETTYCEFGCGKQECASDPEIEKMVNMIFRDI